MTVMGLRISRAGMLSGLFGGLLSGAITFAAISFFSKSGELPALSDAIAIANTYIVFTTIIFVAITIFLTVAGIWFTHQFASSKQLQTTHLMDELEQKLLENKDDFGIKFVEQAFRNADVSRHLQQKIEEKVRELLEQRKRESNKEIEAVDDLSKSLGGS